MPTGYTDGVGDGAVTEFREFAMTCARAFGALIEMRDSPADAEIPDEFKPSDYHAKALEAAKTRVQELAAMGDGEIARATEEANRSAHESWVERRKRTALTMERYRAMLAEVRAWKPPTADHVEIKRFMVEQLEESIRLDGHEWERPERQSPDDWHATEIATAARNVEYHVEEMEKERQRARERTEWVRALRESLREAVQ